MIHGHSFITWGLGLMGLGVALRKRDEGQRGLGTTGFRGFNIYTVHGVQTLNRFSLEYL